MDRINKPVGFCLLGPSLGELDSAIEHFRDIDMFWISLSYFWVAEKILKRIGKQLDEIYEIPYDDLVTPMLPDLIASGRKIIQGGEMVEEDGSVFEENGPGGEEGYPSFYFILKLLKSRGANQVFLFGANGFAASLGQTYYNQKDISYIPSYASGGVNQDADRFNKLVEKHKPYKDMDIYNCCLESKYTPFPIINVYEAIELLTAPLSIYDSVPKEANA